MQVCRVRVARLLETSLFCCAVVGPESHSRRPRLNGTPLTTIVPYDSANVTHLDKRVHPHRDEGLSGKAENESSSSRRCAISRLNSGLTDTQRCRVLVNVSVSPGWKQSLRHLFIPGLWSRVVHPVQYAGYSRRVVLTEAFFKLGSKGSLFEPMPATAGRTSTSMPCSTCGRCTSISRGLRRALVDWSFFTVVLSTCPCQIAFEGPVGTYSCDGLGNFV